MFIPISLIMGVNWDESDVVGLLIGYKTVLNEFVAYDKLGTLIKNKAISVRNQFLLWIVFYDKKWISV